MPNIQAVLAQGTLAARPAAAAGNAGYYYWASDDNGGTIYQSTGSAWTKLAPGVSEAGTGGGGAAPAILLDHAETSDLWAGTFGTAGSWVDINADQTFTVASGTALLAVTIGGNAIGAPVAGPAIVGVRVLIDGSTGHLIAGNYVSGPGGTAADLAANLFGGSSPIYLASPTAGSHTMRVQANVTSAIVLYLRCATHPNTEGLSMRVLAYS